MKSILLAALVGVLVNGPILAAEKAMTIGEYMKIYDEGSPALKKRLEKSTATSGRALFVANEYLKLSGRTPLFCPPKDGLSSQDYFSVFQYFSRLPESVKLPAIGRTAILLNGLIFTYPCKK